MNVMHKTTRIGIIAFFIMVAGAATVFTMKKDPVEQKSPNTQTPSTLNDTEGQQSATNRQQGGAAGEDDFDRNITVSVGSQRYEATLADNETARAFHGKLPLTVTMNDVNGNEKAYDLPDALPSNHANPGRVNDGDLMLYGSRTLVLFYETFATPYTYTRIGHLNDPADLVSVLGSGDAEVTFEP